jgi:hypothetical protein
MSKFAGKKTDNGPLNIKLDLRRESVSKINNCDVLEIFCGSGKMYNLIWSDYRKYTGIDKVKQFDKRHTICGDALKALTKLKLSDYNVFDIDSYGSPYMVLNYVSRNLKINRKTAFIITDGSSMDLRMGRISEGIRSIINIDNHILKKANNIHHFLIDLIIKKTCEKMSAKVDNFKIAKGNTGASVIYYFFTVSPLN